MSEVHQIISVMKHKYWCFQRNNISKTVHFGILIHILSWNILDYWEKTWTENQQLFDVIIDIKLFDGVEGLD